MHRKKPSTKANTRKLFVRKGYPDFYINFYFIDKILLKLTYYLLGLVVADLIANSIYLEIYGYEKRDYFFQIITLSIIACYYTRVIYRWYINRRLDNMGSIHPDIAEATRIFVEGEGFKKIKKNKKEKNERRKRSGSVLP